MGTVRTVALPTGASIAYAESGDPKGPAVVCLHGYGDSLRSFDLMAAAMPAEFRLIATSHRGHPGSSLPADGFAPSRLTADAIAFLEALGLNRAVVVGHSMGSVIAQNVAIEAPARVRGLVLIGAFVSVVDHPDIRQIWNDVIKDMTDPIDADFVRAFQTGTTARPVPPDFMATIIAESMAIPARVWREEMAGLLAPEPARDLGRIRAPTLIIWGDQDSLFGRADQDALLRGIPRARLSTYAGVGHGVQWEVPERTAADVAAFARGLTA